MSTSVELTNARTGKNDEFYTQYEDIEKWEVIFDFPFLMLIEGPGANICLC